MTLFKDAVTASFSCLKKHFDNEKAALGGRLVVGKIYLQSSLSSSKVSLKILATVSKGAEVSKSTPAILNSFTGSRLQPVGEKFLVAFYRRLALFEYFVGYADGACYAGGVLVDVKASVKMGYTAPFVSYLSVVLHCGTVVFFVEPVVNVGQAS